MITMVTMIATLKNCFSSFASCEDKISFFGEAFTLYFDMAI